MRGRGDRGLSGSEGTGDRERGRERGDGGLRGKEGEKGVRGRGD